MAAACVTQEPRVRQRAMYPVEDKDQSYYLTANRIASNIIFKILKHLDDANHDIYIWSVQ